MVTIKDISKRSGYSVSTISKVLNNYPDIPEHTREIILKLMKEMRYVPNSTARSLKTARSYTIGVIFEEITQQGLQHPLFSKILESFKSDVEKKGYDILFLAKSMGQQTGSYYEHSIRKQVDAVLVLCADFNSDEMHELYASELPLVVIDYKVENAFTVTSNNDSGMRLGIEHLIERGHSKIAHIHGELDSFIGGTRKESFENHMKEHGLSVPAEYLVNGPFYSKENGYQAMQELLALENLPTAIFCASDLLAIGAIEAIKDAGKKVPDDFSIIGFDGIDLSQMITPRLTTIKQDSQAMGTVASSRIMSMIDQTEKKEGESISIQTELIVGQSTRALH
jgi:LacI family transcriptional regulator